MELPFIQSTILVLVGAGAGLATSVLGIGGGIVIVPSLLAVLPLLRVPDQFTPEMALATSLAVSVVTAIMSAYSHWRLGNLKKPFAPEKLGLMVCAGAGAAFGAVSMIKAPPALAAMVIVAAQCFLCWSMLRRGHRKAKSAPVEAGASSDFNARAPGPRLYFSVVGLLTAIGAGGSLIVPYLSVKGVEHREAVGLAGWLGLLIGLSALVVYATKPVAGVAWTLGAVHLPAALLVAMGSVLGVRHGAVLATRVNQDLLRKVLALFLIASSGRILIHLAT